MATGAGEKTEKPTPKRREEARKKGQVAKSPDLNGAIVLLTALFALSIWGPHIWNQLGASMHDTLAMIARPRALTPTGIARVFMEGGQTAALAVGPIALVCPVFGGAANIGQGTSRPSQPGL